MAGLQSVNQQYVNLLRKRKERENNFGAWLLIANSTSLMKKRPSVGSTRSLGTRVSGQPAVASSCQSAARAQLCQHRRWSPSQPGLNSLSQAADSQIPAAHRQGEAPHPRMGVQEGAAVECSAVQLAFGFDGGLDSSSVLVRVEVQDRHHRRVFGVERLRIGREGKVLSVWFLEIKNKGV